MHPSWFGPLAEVAPSVQHPYGDLSQVMAAAAAAAAAASCVFPIDTKLQDKMHKYWEKNGNFVYFK